MCNLPYTTVLKLNTVCDFYENCMTDIAVVIIDAVDYIDSCLKRSSFTGCSKDLVSKWQHLSLANIVVQAISRRGLEVFVISIRWNNFSWLFAEAFLCRMFQMFFL